MTLPLRAFCVIRHGQTDANRDGIIAGRIEAQLTVQGRAAASALAALHWPERIALFTSPQDRAQETARLAFPGQSAHVINALRERDWGVFEGQPVSTLPPRDATPEGGEGWPAMLLRVGAALREADSLAGDALPVLIAHSGVIRSIRALTGGDFGGPSAANTTPILFTPADGRWSEQLLFPKKDPL